MSERLLNTREAARFLRASEASIRRWADSALLPASRVGRRRARRFKEDDLVRFMRPDDLGPAARTVQPGSIVIQQMVVPLGTHLISLYSSDAGRLRLALPFLRDGLLAGQTCLLLATADVRDQYVRALRREKVDVDAAERSQLLTYVSTAPASPEKRIAYFERLLTEVSRLRSGPIRFIGECFANMASVKSMQAHLTVEQAWAALVKRFPIVVLCPYDARQFAGVSLLEALKLHSDTFEFPLGYFLS